MALPNKLISSKHRNTLLKSVL